MSLRYHVKPDSSPSNKSPKVEETNAIGFTSRSTKIFNNSVRYLQRTLLGFDADADNTHLALLKPEIFTWKEQGQVLNGDTNNFACDGQPSTLGITGSESLFQTPPKHRVSVNHMPVELLQEIFSYLLPSRDWMLRRSPPPQLALVQVCTYWRNIALSYPRLWSTIMIIQPIGRHISMTKLWLERSGQHPLTLYIDHRWFKQDVALITTNIVINLLRPHAHRWKVAIFALPSGIQPSLLTFPPGNEFPLLEILCFDVIGNERFWDKIDVERIEEIFLSSSPRLRELTWKTYGLSLNKPPSIPTNLTYLAGDFALGLPFFEMLSKMKNLQTLRLYQLEGDTPDRSRLYEPLILHRLRSLDIHLGSECMPFFLDLVRAPSLNVLLIGRPIAEEAQKALCTFLQKSHCYLKAFTYLETSGSCMEFTLFEDVLLSPQMIYLVELNILAVYENFNPLLRLLAQVDFEYPVLPALNRLWLSGWSCSGDVLVDMLEHRAKDFHPPTQPLISEPLFDRDYCLSGLHRNEYLPASTCSLRLHFEYHDHLNEILEWYRCNFNRAHWKFRKY
ncbi:hypothetical protein DFJ43DRAFT_1160869 [Lentinula guzmanii]|uniref:F-box domain-containing protein n=1 Tax=Lentinula guzmanii TaxID=2804957 RepID=A0AA38JFB8_9AGAR|nr:hypothetical protein DFJ43DRAFT_1160869 [Lentinula guzmanii]